MREKPIPPEILDAAAGMLSRFGVDLPAVLSRHSSPPPAVETLQKRYLSVAEAIQYCGVRRWSLWKAERDGKIKAVKLNAARAGRVLYDRASIDDWLGSCKKRARSEA